MDTERDGNIQLYTSNLNMYSNVKHVVLYSSLCMLLPHSSKLHLWEQITKNIIFIGFNCTFFCYEPFLSTYTIQKKLIMPNVLLLHQVKRLPFTKLCCPFKPNMIQAQCISHLFVIILYYLCKYLYTLLWLKCVTIRHSHNRLCISWYVPILKRLKC